MSYRMCTPTERTIVDNLMAGQFTARNFLRDMAGLAGVATSTMKRQLTAIYIVYGIDSRAFNPHVRLVYLRALELGMLP